MVSAHRETKWQSKKVSTELPQVIERRYWESNGGRSAYEILVDRVNGIWEVGPIGPHGATIQFGSSDGENPFDGTFSALVAVSLKPGRTNWKNDEDDMGGRTVAGLMHPRADASDYDREFAIGDTGTMFHIDGPVSRVRIIVQDFAPGSGGGLACWVL